MEQRNLFDRVTPSPHPPAQRHSATSVDAAEAIEPSADSLRGAVLEALRKAGADGMTDEEMQTALNMNPSTQRPRRIELMRLGLVRDGGATRPTRSGRKAVVWVATTAGGADLGPGGPGR